MVMSESNNSGKNTTDDARRLMSRREPKFYCIPSVDSDEPSNTLREFRLVSKDVRVIAKDGMVWFTVIDIAKFLGLGNIINLNRLVKGYWEETQEVVQEVIKIKYVLKTVTIQPAQVSDRGRRGRRRSKPNTQTQIKKCRRKKSMLMINQYELIDLMDAVSEIRPSTCVPRIFKKWVMKYVIPMFAPLGVSFNDDMCNVGSADIVGSDDSAERKDVHEQ